MGPAKVPQKINKIRIKRYEDSPGSSKERKITDVAIKWSHDELKQFYKAYHRYGKDWKKISTAVGRKSSDMVEALYNMHRAFLSLPKHEATAVGFIALVTGHYNVLDESTNHRGNDHKVRASVKAKKRGAATLQKVYEGPHPDDSFPEGTIPGFSPTFKKRYYGALARNSQSHIVGRRTPRIPVIIAADRAATPENRDTISSTKDDNEVMNNNGTKFPTNECSPDGSFLVMETTEATQGQTFLETNRTSDTEICQTQQHLKRRRIEQTMGGCRISKVEHETMMVAEEGNKSVGLLDQKQIVREFFSADDMLVLDVLQSLLNAPNEISNLKINITPGTLEESDSALSRGKDEGHPSLDLSEQEKPVVECTASKALHNKQEKLSIGEEPAKETNAVHAIDITEGSSYSESAERTRDLMGSTANISSEMCAYAPREIEPEISMSRRSKMKSEMNRKIKYMSCNGISDNLQASKLLHCLSSELLRRWCTYEWFYSAIDFPWFRNSELAKYVNHVNLSHVPRLTRSEWITIRSSLGKPRRFSNHFLVTEKENLEDYREKVRKCYAQLSVGLMDYLPAGLALPFSIGQQVAVLHPRSRELCDGKVVMVKPDCCKVQFDNPDLGVELVKDTDCMPANWLDNLPENIRSSSFSCNVRDVMVMEHIPKLTTSDNQDRTSNDVSISKLPKSLHTSNEQLKVDYPVESERRLEKSTFDDTGRSRGCPNNNVGHNDELEAYITSFVQSSQSQARQIVDEVMQEISGGNYRQDEEAGTWNQAACFIVPESESAISDAPLPSNLILNCTATVLAIKRLADLRHPPANIAGVLERLSSTLRPSCSENLAIYKEIEKHISIITNQTIALVPTIVDDGCCPCL